MKVLIPDHTIELLEPFVTPTKPLETLIDQCLHRFGHVGPSARYVLLTEADLVTLEKRLGAPVISDAKSLYQAVDTLADIEIGSVKVEFTPHQYREIQDRAQREGVQPVETIKRIVHAMIPQFFSIAAIAPPVVTAKGK